MKLRLLLGASVVLALTVPAGVQAQQKNTICDVTFDGDVSPGFWREGNSGTFTSNGETGTATCDGPVNGKMPTGPGTFGVSGHYGTKDPDTCDNIEGDYVASTTVPVAGGTETITDSGTWYGGVFKGGGAFGGEFSGDGAYGTFDVTPREGDCVTKPVTKIHVTGHRIHKG